MTKWLNKVDPAHISDDAARLYDEYKAAYALAKAARIAFEDCARAAIEEQHGVDANCIAINYNFGGLNVGIGEARERKVAKPAQSLADWLASQS